MKKNQFCVMIKFVLTVCSNTGLDNFISFENKLMDKKKITIAFQPIENFNPEKVNYLINNMKTIVLSIFVVVMSFMDSFSQVYTINISNTYGFEHSSTITTDMAMRNDGMVYTRGGTTEAKFVVNLNTMKVFYSSWNQKHEIELNISEIVKTKAILNIVYKEPNGTPVSMIVDESVNPESGVVIIFRYNEMVNEIPKTIGWFSENVNVTSE